ncbi:MAG: hypothetical protein F6K55_23820 [Moorea sp. SIO4A3]|nr:hypothetical protein [Moorena sp. SIO4A3]
MTNTLLVPIHLDALYLNKKQGVVEEMTDYSELPYWDGQPYNNDNPYISDSVLNEPFEALNLNLKGGIHLHWALPDALTQGQVQDDGSIEFPLVPNRWLIMRRGGNLPVQQWVVESDYLYADGEKPDDTINILHDPTGEDGDRRPFRYLGRKLKLDQWQAGDDAEYIEALSAMGPFKQLTSLDNEKATFAAFYPNCRSVFGFHDPDCTQSSPPEGLQYDVIGWYSSTDKDYFTQFLQDHSEEDPETLKASIKEVFGWNIDEIEDPATLEGMLCYSRLTFTASGPLQDPVPQLDNPTIAVGNSPTEALAAYLASQLSQNRTYRQIIEEQLEALELNQRFVGEELDVGPRFDQARHETGFSRESSGLLWRVMPVGNKSLSTDALSPEQTTLPPEIAGQLNTLNLRQQEYDRALAKMGMMREQLYADWHKYMLALYNGQDQGMDQLPTDEWIQEFIDLDEKYQGDYNGCSIYDLEQAIAQTGTLELVTWDEEEVTGAEAVPPSTESIAGKLATAINEIIDTLNDFNHRLQELTSACSNPSQLCYLLKIEPAPGYWEANEPVILMTGDAVTYGNRNGQDGRLQADGLLECQVLTDKDIDMQGLPDDTLVILKEKLEELGKLQGEKIGFQDWSAQPWNPFLLQWSVQLFPVNHTQGESQGTYDPNLLTNNYQLPVNGADMLLRDKDDSDFMEGANLYSGACILTPSVNTILQKQIDLYLTKVLLPRYKEESDPSADDFSNHWQEIKTWYEEQPEMGASEQERVNDPIYTALRAYEILQSLPCLAQGLGGFNDALLTYKREMQLEVKDPVAVGENQDFHESVRNAIAQGDVPGSVLRGPLIFNEFNPWRTGALDISGLRIVDTFGRVQDMEDIDHVVTTAAMTPPSSSHPIYLPPRLAQPARLNFQWLSASEGEVETNDHPATTPICGWLVPNYLDNSLMVYNTHGQSLGMIQVRNDSPLWLPMPGRDSRPNIENIKSQVNPYLGQLLDYLVNHQNEGFFTDFLTAVNAALESIEPDNYAQHQSIALMMGRPLALVRARVNLELKGQPSISQNAGDTKVDVEVENPNVPRTTHEFAKVKLPIRIGDYRQLNDALVGYWIEGGENTYQDDMFYAPQSIYVPNPNIKTLFENEGDETPDTPINLEQTLEPEKAQTLAMLVDPRGKINATCGFLPARTISIPTEQYARALQSIEVTFLSAPIIGSPERDRLQISLPEDADYGWSWLAKDGAEWSETTEIGKFDANTNFVGANKIHEGWLKLSQAATDNS